MFISKTQLFACDQLQIESIGIHHLPTDFANFKASHIKLSKIAILRLLRKVQNVRCQPVFLAGESNNGRVNDIVHVLSSLKAFGVQGSFQILANRVIHSPLSTLIQINKRKIKIHFI